MAEGSQTFEARHRPPDQDGLVDPQRRPGPCRLAHQPDVALVERLQRKVAKAAAVPEEDDEASFTEITLDVKHR